MKLTRWYTIDVDGQPHRAGMYDVLYEGQDEPPFQLLWDGTAWLDEHGRPTEFGNYATTGERWRGLAKRPKDYEVPHATH